MTSKYDINHYQSRIWQLQPSHSLGAFQVYTLLVQGGYLSQPQQPTGESPMKIREGENEARHKERDACVDTLLCSTMDAVEGSPNHVQQMVSYLPQRASGLQRG